MEFLARTLPRRNGHRYETVLTLMRKELPQPPADRLLDDVQRGKGVHDLHRL
jgi:hypothetical protein